jgi:uncharacterized protein YneR
MKKGINIFFTVMGSIMNTNDSINDSLFGSDLFEKLQGVGILFLGIVKISMFFFVFLMMVLIPMILYRAFRSTDSDFEFIKEWGKYILIFLSGISLFSIAGVQLRNLEQFPKYANEVTIKKQGTNPVIEENDYFYFDTTKNDWVETSKIDYSKKSENPSTLLYSCKSETKYYRKNRYGNWIEENDTLINKYKSLGAQILKMTPKPKIEYYLFSVNNWKKITKEEFINYRELDSIVRYE